MWQRSSSVAATQEQTMPVKKRTDMTPEELADRRAKEREASRWSRAKAKGLALPGTTEDGTMVERRAKADLTVTWEKNLSQATPEDKALLGAWALNVNDLEVSLEILAEPPSDENKAVLATLAEDIDAYVKEHPPTRDIFYQRLQNTSPKDVGFGEIAARIKDKTLGPLMSRFGIPADHAHTPIYHHYVSAAREYALPKRELIQPVSVPALTATEQFRLQHAAYLAKTGIEPQT